MVASELFKIWQSLEGQKSQRRDLLISANQFFEPSDEILMGVKKITSPEGVETRQFLDSTCLEAFRDYQANVLNIATPSEMRWFSIGHIDIDPLSDDQKVLNRRADRIFKMLANTNYYEQIPLMERDIVGAGHSAMIINKEKPFAKCLTCNPLNLYFEVDQYGEAVKIFYENFYTLEGLIKDFPDLKEKLDLKKKQGPELAKLYGGDKEDQLRVLICLYSGLQEFLFGEDDKDEGGWILRYYFIDSRGLLKKEFGEKIKKVNKKNQDSIEITLYQLKEKERFQVLPIIPVRDGIARGAGYGYGKYRDLLYKARILNFLAYGKLDMVHKQMDPPLSVSNDILNKGASFSAGARYIQEVSQFTERMNDPVRILETKGDIQVVDAIHMRHQEEVYNVLPTASSIYKTARQSIDEIAARTQQEERKLAPLRSCFTREGLARHIRRFYNIAEKMGEFDGEEFQLQNSEIDISAENERLTFSGFLLQKNLESQAKALLRALNKSSVMASYSPQELGRIDGGSVLEAIWSGEGVMSFLKSDSVFAEEQKRTIDEANRKEQQEVQETGAQSVGALAKIAEVFKGGLRQ